MIIKRFCNKSKYQIKRELIDLGFTEGQAQQIIDRMEDQIRSVKKSPIDNFENFCFDVNYSKTDNCLDFNDVQLT